MLINRNIEKDATNKRANRIQILIQWVLFFASGMTTSPCTINIFFKFLIQILQRITHTVASFFMHHKRKLLFQYTVLQFNVAATFLAIVAPVEIDLSIVELIISSAKSLNVFIPAGQKASSKKNENGSDAAMSLFVTVQMVAKGGTFVSYTFSAKRTYSGHSDKHQHRYCKAEILAALNICSTC